MSNKFLEAMLGAVYSRETGPLELSGGLNFTRGLRASVNTTTGLIDVVVDLLAPIEIILLGGLHTSQATTYADKGAHRFDASQFPATVGGLSLSLTFEAYLSTTSGAVPATVQLYDLTAGAPVAGTVLTSTSLVTSRTVSSSLTLPQAAHDYVLQLKAGGSPSPTDSVMCLGAVLRVTYS